ncbi:MAG: hypothetical protein ACREFE_01825 [Limisphaerales bacterium]
MKDKSKIDEWFFQYDVKKSIAALEIYKADFIPILERRESYIEYFAAYCVPVPINHIKAAFADASWGNEYDLSRNPIMKHGATHYLSLKFRRMFKPCLLNPCYYDETQSHIIARRKKQITAICKNEKILVSKMLIHDFLKETRQALLWCIRSHRDSERSWSEFGNEFQNQTFKSETYNYLQERIDYEAKPARDRPRMQSGTLLFGKFLICKPTL